MATIHADRRSIEATADAGGERIAVATAAEYLDVRLRMARALLRIERSGTYHLSSCSSIVQYGVRLGIPAADVRMLVDLGRALEASDTAATPVPVEERVRAGALSAESAALVGRLLAQPGVIQPGEDWFAKAQSIPTPELRRNVNERLEQAAQGVPTLVPVTVHVTETVRSGFARARVIASREAALWLTEGQTFALLVSHYLDTEDELRRGARSRRIGDTSDRPGERYVPSSVRRAVLDRSGDRCEVPGCALDTFLELAHVEAHAEAGSREADNLLRLCHVHHVQFDADCLHFAGWRDGRPQFRDARGALLSQRSAMPPPARDGSHDDLAEVRTADRCNRAIQVCARSSAQAPPQTAGRPPPLG